MEPVSLQKDFYNSTNSVDKPTDIVQDTVSAFYTLLGLYKDCSEEDWQAACFIVHSQQKQTEEMVSNLHQLICSEQETEVVPQLSDRTPTPVKRQPAMTLFHNEELDTYNLDNYLMTEKYKWVLNGHSKRFILLELYLKYLLQYDMLDGNPYVGWYPLKLLKFMHWVSSNFYVSDEVETLPDNFNDSPFSLLVHKNVSKLNTYDVTSYMMDNFDILKKELKNAGIKIKTNYRINNIGISDASSVEFLFRYNKI